MLRISFERALKLAEDTGTTVDTVSKQFEVVDIVGEVNAQVATVPAKPTPKQPRRTLVVADSDRKEFACKIVKTVDNFTKTLGYIYEAELEALIDGLIARIPEEVEAK